MESVWLYLLGILLKIEHSSDLLVSKSPSQSTSEISFNLSIESSLLEIEASACNDKNPYFHILRSHPREFSNNKWKRNYIYGIIWSIKYDHETLKWNNSHLQGDLVCWVIRSRLTDESIPIIHFQSKVVRKNI